MTNYGYQTVMIKVGKMKKNPLFLFLLVFVWTFTFLQPAFAHKKEEKPAVQYHQRMAKRYKSKADRLQIEISKHRKMKEEYENMKFVAQNPEHYITNSEQINSHSGSIISAAQKLKEEYEAFARWHEDVAVELKQKH